ncbi:hypothetical protein AAVH_38677 [Aphelenchoides avenae]|nr:hypothetical protein AAVH_38677 [Aphelenchus avenae]
MTVFWKSDACYAYIRKECVEKRSLEKCYSLDRCPPPIDNGTVVSRSLAVNADIPDQTVTVGNASLVAGLNVFLPFLASLLVLTYLD